MISVAMVNTEIKRGGAARLAETLTRTLGDGFQDIEVILYHCSDAKKEHPFWGLKKPLARPINAGLARIGGSFWVFDLGLARQLIALTSKADVLHLHNPHGYYLNYAKLLQAWKYRPVVWTWHDMWGATGRCGSSSSCENWQTGCKKCPHKNYYPAAWIDRAAAEFRAKTRLFANLKKLTIVTPSQWLANIAIRRGFAPDLVHIIPNPAAAEKFKTADMASARRQLQLDKDCCIALFIASDCGDPRKGYSDFVGAVRAVGCLGVAVGKLPAKPAEGILHTDRIEDQATINRYFCAADVMLIPTYADNYPNTVIEALMSGTPVIGYAEGGLPSQLNLPHCSLVTRGDREALVGALHAFVAQGGKNAAIANELAILAHRRWAPATAATQYHRLYLSVIGRG